MSETVIERDVVYQHDQLGEVLVTGISKMYDEWDVSGPREDIESRQVMVHFYDRFDGYGGMPSGNDTEEVNEFAKKVTRERAFDYDRSSELRVDE